MSNFDLSLVRFIEKTRRNPVYTDFEDELGESASVDLPGITPGTNFERFRAKAAAYLRAHEDHVALPRLRRNKPLTGEDLAALEQMLVASGGRDVDISWALEQNGGLGLFIRSLVGLDRAAALDAFSRFLDDGQFSVSQVRFINLIIDELTATGVVEPRRLFESPYTDYAPTGPEQVFPKDVDGIVKILIDVKENASPRDVA